MIYGNAIYQKTEFTNPSSLLPEIYMKHMEDTHRLLLLV